MTLTASVVASRFRTTHDTRQPESAQKETLEPDLHDGMNCLPRRVRRDIVGERDGKENGRSSSIIAYALRGSLSGQEPRYALRLAHRTPR
jgi:hypothetical protein